MPARFVTKNYKCAEDETSRKYVQALIDNVKEEVSEDAKDDKIDEEKFDQAIEDLVK